MLSRLWPNGYEPLQFFKDEETYDVICGMLNLQELGKDKSQYQNTETEDLDMCKAFEDMKIKYWDDGKAEGRAKGEAVGEKRGETRGKKIGKKIGEQRMCPLISSLLSDGRQDDVASAVGSQRVRSRLYREYGI